MCCRYFFVYHLSFFFTVWCFFSLYSEVLIFILKFINIFLHGFWDYLPEAFYAACLHITADPTAAFEGRQGDELCVGSLLQVNSNEAQKGGGTCPAEQILNPLFSLPSPAFQPAKSLTPGTDDKRMWFL